MADFFGKQLAESVKIVRIVTTCFSRSTSRVLPTECRDTHMTLFIAVLPVRTRKKCENMCTHEGMDKNK